MKTNVVSYIVIVLVVLAGGYWYFFGRGVDQAPITASSDQNAAQTQFQSLVGELQGITFDTGIFADSRFMALVDLSVPVTPEPAGRLDPFAQIQGVTTPAL